MSVPEEITMLRSLLDGAITETIAAEDARDAADAAYEEARDRLVERENSLRRAVADEDAAFADYRAALRAHGYVQLATGPKPKEVADALKRATGGDFWPASAGGIVQTRDGEQQLEPGRHAFRFQTNDE